MPVTKNHDEPQPHRERGPQEGPQDSAHVFESVDPLAAAARLDEEPADNEAEDRETMDERLKREATSLESEHFHATWQEEPLLRVLSAGCDVEEILQKSQAGRRGWREVDT